MNNPFVMADGSESLVEAIGRGGSADDNLFDQIVGHLEDVVVAPEFEHINRSFLERHCHEFDHSEENKIIYTILFQQYTNTIEKFLETELAKRMPGFSMQRFMDLLRTRHDQISGDILDLLTSLGDFLSFKEVMLASKDNGFDQGDDGELDLAVSSMPIHSA